MDAVLQHATPLHGTLRVPPDKAIGHRAVVAASLAHGTTEIRSWPSAEDCQQTLRVVQALGVSVRTSSDTVWIEGRGGEPFPAPDGELFCGESGTTLRLVAGVLAAQPITARLSAGPSLSRRPMRRIVEPLTRMGARVEGVSMSGSPDVHPPLTIHGKRPLSGIRYEPSIPSAQVKSAILFAGLSADRPTTVIEHVATRDHTERMLRAYGAGLRRVGGEITVEPGVLRSPGSLVIPGDCSSAAFFLVAASIVPDSTLTIEGMSLNPTRLAFLEILRRMGASVTLTLTEDAWEPRGHAVVEARSLRATSVASCEVPGVIDELPILMAAAACAEGLTRFQGIGELRVKETDRIRSMVDGLRRMGAKIAQPDPEVVEIEGGPLRGAIVESAGDHRTAMSLAIAGLVAQGATTVKGADCVAKSFPEFFEHLQRVAGSTTVKTVDKLPPVC